MRPGAVCLHWLEGLDMNHLLGVGPPINLSTTRDDVVRLTTAEGGGFEPPEAFTSHAFEACALVRSATLPPASVTEAGRGPEMGAGPPSQIPGLHGVHAVESANR